MVQIQIVKDARGEKMNTNNLVNAANKTEFTHWGAVNSTIEFLIFCIIAGFIFFSRKR